MSSMIYLASPYTHSNPKVVQERYDRVMSATIRLLLHGNHVLSPIVYSHPIAVDKQWAGVGEGGTFSVWSQFDYDLIDRCDLLAVLMLEGWKQSTGVTAECEHAQATGKPVIYLPKEMGDELQEQAGES